MRLIYAVLLVTINLYATTGQSELVQRNIRISNNTELEFDLQPYPFEGAYFTPFTYVLGTNSETSFKLINHDSMRPANGVLAFMLSGRYVFSLVMKDNMIFVHGCKSKNVFYHPEDYVCNLIDTNNGKYLKISRPSNAS